MADPTPPSSQAPSLLLGPVRVGVFQAASREDIAILGQETRCQRALQPPKNQPPTYPRPTPPSSHPPLPSPQDTSLQALHSKRVSQMGKLRHWRLCDLIKFTRLVSSGLLTLLQGSSWHYPIYFSWP